MQTQRHTENEQQTLARLDIVRCTCDAVNNHEHGYHDEECDRVQQWMGQNPVFFPVYGEIERGGVWVLFDDDSKIMVECKGYFFFAEEEDEADDEAIES